MAAAKAHLLSRAVQRRQDPLRTGAATAGMPQIIKPSLWERAREAYFGQRPRTRREILASQMAANGDE